MSKLSKAALLLSMYKRHAKWVAIWRTANHEHPCHPSTTSQLILSQRMVFTMGKQISLVYSARVAVKSVTDSGPSMPRTRGEHMVSIDRRTARRLVTLAALISLRLAWVGTLKITTWHYSLSPTTSLLKTNTRDVAHKTSPTNISKKRT